MTIIHDLPKEFIDTIVKYGVIVDEPDARYYNLPQWFRKDDNGLITEVSFKELPDQCKHVHLFSLDEMKDCYREAWGEGGIMEDERQLYFLQRFNIDISK